MYLSEGRQYKFKPSYKLFYISYALVRGMHMINGISLDRVTLTLIAKYMKSMLKPLSDILRPNLLNFSSWCSMTIKNILKNFRELVRRPLLLDIIVLLVSNFWAAS